MNITYDKDADVLYITLQDVEAVAEEQDTGDFIRYYNDKTVAGITIMDFKERYQNEN